MLEGSPRHFAIFDWRMARDAGFDTGTATAHAIVPVILGSLIAAARYWQKLLERGINVQPIIYPRHHRGADRHPAGGERIRPAT